MADTGKADEKNLHEQHRSRLRGQFMEHGLDGFTDVQALETLLFYSIPRGDTNKTAHLLLNQFHGFRGVMEAGMEDLKRVKGIGENSAALIALVSALNKRYLANLSRKGAVLSTTEEMAEFVKNKLAYEKREKILMVCLDTSNKVLCHKTLAEGSVNSVVIPMRSVVDTALRENASGIVLAHNHIADYALPSNTDVSTTGKLKRILDLLDIELIDHFIVADGDCVSMRDSGYFRSFLC